MIASRFMKRDRDGYLGGKPARFENIGFEHIKRDVATGGVTNVGIGSVRAEAKEWVEEQEAKASSTHSQKLWMACFDWEPSGSISLTTYGLGSGMPINSAEIAKLDREIELIQARVQRQRELIVQLVHSGSDTEAAERLLAVIVAKLEKARARRDALGRP
jgi:hypothetical protein